MSLRTSCRFAQRSLRCNRARGNVAAEEDVFVVFAVFDHADLVAHAPFANHAARDGRGLLDVAAAPLVMSPKTISSAMRPPMVTARLSSISFLRLVYLSPPAATWSSRATGRAG